MEFKKCKNGHYYRGDVCPYCPSGSQNDSESTSAATEMFGGGGAASPSGPTLPTEPYNVGAAERTEVFGGGMNLGGANGETIKEDAPFISPASPTEKTGFWDPNAGENGGEAPVRMTRKLVGWLVSYTIDPLGCDYKLFEGRNVIGRSMECNITVAGDQMMSGKHATILYKNGTYRICDEMSTHGTLVNGVDIDVDKVLLKDGDKIQMGDTIFLFRTSIL